MSRAKRFLSAVEFPEINEFPANPNPGRLVFIAGILYIYANLGAFSTWFPINRPQSSYVHSQGVAALVWRVYHGMGTSQVIVAVYDGQNNIIDTAVQHVQDVNGDWYTEVTLSTPDVGYAVVFGTETISAPIINAVTMEVTQNINIDSKPVMVDEDIAVAFDALTAEFNSFAAN